MRIAMIAPIEEPIPPYKYGGAEIVIHNLIEGLMNAGHDVTLFASGDSSPRCRLVQVIPHSIRNSEQFKSEKDSRKWEWISMMVIHSLIKTLHPGEFDVIHDHLSWKFQIFSDLINLPSVSTHHGIIGNPADKMIYEQYPHTRIVGISLNQSKGNPNISYQGIVYNGIDLEKYPFYDGLKEDYLLFLGRFSYEKGVKEAIEIARKAGKEIKLAYKTDPRDQWYIDECKELLKQPHVTVIGEVGLEEKIKLLHKAKALVAPIQWEEPFGLVVVEAMAVGTPVLAISRGAFPEIIQHGKHGFLANTADELVGFVDRVSEIERADCRKQVETKFTKEIMTEKYVEIYNKVIQNWHKNNEDNLHLLVRHPKLHQAVLTI